MKKTGSLVTDIVVYQYQDPKPLRLFGSEFSLMAAYIRVPEEQRWAKLRSSTFYLYLYLRHDMGSGLSTVVTLT
jgi:hypothetical protein